MKKNIEDMMFEIEQNYDVENIAYNGIRLWPFLRGQIYSLFFHRNHNDNADSSRKSRRVFDRIIESINAMIKTDYRLLKTKDRCLVFTTNYQVYKENGKIINRLTKAVEDNIVDFTPILQINKNKSGKMYGGCYINERMINDKIALSARKHSIPEEAVSNVTVLKSICNELDLEFDYLHYISFFSAGIDYYLKWFEKISPKALFLECYYDTKMCASFAAKKLGIPVIEIQHGIINDKCFEYNSMKNIPDNPYPDWLFSYGRSEVEAIGDHNIYSSDQIIPVGSYFIEKKRSEKQDEPPYEKKRENRIVAAVIGQYTIDGKLLSIIKNIAAEEKDILFVFVPRIMDEWYRSFESENIYIEDSLDVYSVMKSSDVVLTVYSTCGIEAVALGIPVVVIDIDGLGTYFYERYENTLRSLKIVPDEKAVVPGIHEVMNNKKENGNEAEYLICSDHFNKVKEGLNKVFGGVSE